MPRLTIEFPDKANTVLEELSTKEETSKVEVLRRALALYDYLHREAFNTTDRKVMIVGRDSEPVKEIILK